MRFIHRMLLFLSSLLLLTVGSVLLVNFLGQAVFHNVYILHELTRFLKNMIWWKLLIVFVFLYLGYKLLRYSFRRMLEEKRIVYETKLGEVIVSQEAIESLVGRACRKIKGVKDVDVEVKTRSEEIKINVELSVSADLNLPSIQNEVRERIQEYLQETLGRKADKLKVSVNKIISENRSKIEWGA